LTRRTASQKRRGKREPYAHTSHPGVRNHHSGDDEEKGQNGPITAKRVSPLRQRGTVVTCPRGDFSWNANKMGGRGVWGGGKGERGRPVRET